MNEIKKFQQQMEGHIIWGQRGAVVIMDDFKIYLVHIIRDRKHAGRQKKKKHSGLKGRGAPFSPHWRFSFHDQIMPLEASVVIHFFSCH